MNDNDDDGIDAWYSGSIKRVLLFASMWFGMGVLTLWFIRRVRQTWEKDRERVGENLEKRPPLLGMQRRADW